MNTIVSQRENNVSPVEKRLSDLGRIGVLMGGYSSEREISLKSGQAIFTALRDAGCQVSPIDIAVKDEKAIFDLIQKFELDVAFIALHGRLGEDGTIQSILEQLGIPYPGSSVEASRKAINKARTQEILKQNNIRIPAHIILSLRKEYRSEKIANQLLSLSRGSLVQGVENGLEPPEAIFLTDPRGFDADSLLRSFPLPVVVKPSCEGSSIGVSCVHEKEQLAVAVVDAFGYGNEVLVEQFISGKELTVGILGQEALPVIEICPKGNFFDFSSKYQSGMSEYIVPANIPEQTAALAQSVAVASHRALMCEDFSRVDMILDSENQLYVLEINTIPGFTSTSLLPKAAKCAGMDFTSLCLKLIQFAYEKKR